MSKHQWKIAVMVLIGAICLFSLAWFLSVRFPGDAGQNLAAWVQAVGSVGAIIGAFLVGRQTITEERRDRRQSIVAVAAAAAEHGRRIREVLDKGDDPGNARMYNVYDKTIIDGIVHALTGAPAHEVGSSGGVMALLALRDQCVFLGMEMDKYLGGPRRIPEFVREVDSCEDNPEYQRIVIEGQKRVLVYNVCVHLDQIQRHYGDLRKAVERA